MQDELGAVLHMLVDVDDNKYVTHVICRSIIKAMELYEELSRNQCGKCGLITGQCDFNDIMAVFSRWTRGDLSTLITTSTAVAGIDSSHVNIVIFYELFSVNWSYCREHLSKLWCRQVLSVYGSFILSKL